jgi:hypothetical protein
MNNFWLKTKIWTKLILVLLVVVYVAVFAAKNAGLNAQAWVFFTEGFTVVGTSTLQLVLMAFFSGVVVTILFRTALRTVSQIRELKTREAEQQRNREFEELKAKAGMLRVRKDGDGGESPVAKVD